MRYYIADCHFSHANLISQMDKRPFSSVEEMDEAMIEIWNSRVRKRDDVIILGDFCWGNAERTMEILKRLNGRKYLIRGNHDYYLDDKNFDQSLFEWVKDYAELKDNKRKVVLSHYPMVCYNGQYRKDESGQPKTFMLYGHVHDTRDQKFLDAYADFLEGQTCRNIGTGKEEPVPFQIINCFTGYSNYLPLTLDEWIEKNRERREKRKQEPEQTISFEQ